MRRWALVFAMIASVTACPFLAHADFSVSSPILEFTKDGAAQQDVDLTSHSPSNDYIAAAIYEVIHPGLADENRQLIEDPTTAALLVTPNKAILPTGGRKVLRFVLLQEPNEREHIYFVALRYPAEETVATLPLSSDPATILVIVRPAVVRPDYTATRVGHALKISNHGNTNILFQNGRQCLDAMSDSCKVMPALRVYPGQQTYVPVSNNSVVNYAVWDGIKMTEHKY